MAKRILVIEDEEPIRKLLALNLREAGYKVKLCEDAEEGSYYLNESLPDAIILDWMLPAQSGMEYLRMLRQDGRTKDIPVMMLTARVTEADRVLGLEEGADDYLCKPFSPKELLARIKALLRRSVFREAEQGRLEQGALIMDLGAHQVMYNDQEVHLGPTEFRLLEHFMRSPGRVYSRAQLLDTLWAQATEIDERTIDVHIRRLRKSLAAFGAENPIRTIRGAGYGMKK